MMRNALLLAIIASLLMYVFWEQVVDLGLLIMLMFGYLPKGM
jgi:hypothetical protein